MTSSLLKEYLAAADLDQVPPGALAYIANLSTVADVCPDTAQAIVQELADQRTHLKLIASDPDGQELATADAMVALPSRDHGPVPLPIVTEIDP